MASKSPTRLLLPTILLLSAVFLPQPSLSWSPDEEEDDYRRWVAWNVEKFRRRSAPSLSSQLDGAAAPPGSGGLDLKLVKAEASRVMYTVSQDGDGDFRSIREAIDAIPKNNARRVILVIKPGIYREKIVVPKTMPFVTFLGADAASPPVLTGNDTSATAGKDGRAMKTFHSATVAVNADYFVAVNVVFENTAPYPEVGEKGGQAVALRISGNKAAFHGCRFLGTQDTLYDHRGLHYFNTCFIQGSVDFIFGYGRSLYQNCYLNSINRRIASLTAQKRTRASMESGFSFVNSTVTGSGPVYLGRAWGASSRVVFSYTFMDKVVIPQGWNNWHVRRPESSGVFYGEYKCSGPGADWTGRVHWAHLLTDEEAQPFLGTYYVEGETWLMDPPTP